MEELTAKFLKFLLPSDDLIHSSEISSLHQKSLDIAKTFMQTRADIFLGKTENVKPYEHDQMEKLKAREAEFLQKCQSLRQTIEECELEMKRIEYEYSDKKSKLSAVQQKNKQLQDVIDVLKLEKEDRLDKFKETSKHYTTVINWYRDFLHIHIQLSKENSKIFKVVFGQKSDNIEHRPYIQFQATGTNELKLMHCEPSIGKYIHNEAVLHDGCQITTLLCNMKRTLEELQTQKRS